MGLFGITWGSSHDGESPDQGQGDRLSREILGTVYGLIAVFFLVSLASYLPSDAEAIQGGQIDQVSNFGGIVGAMVGHWFLGGFGVNGYFTVLFAIYLAYCAFTGISVRSISLRLIGSTLATALMAIACNLIFGSAAAPDSLLQGGTIGHLCGQFLRFYFNTGGALLLVSGGFLITLLLTTGLSLTRAMQVFRDDEEDDEEEYIEEEIAVPATTAATTASPASVTKPKIRRRKKAADAGDGDDSAEAETIAAPAPTGALADRRLIPYTGQYSVPSSRLLKDAEHKGKKLSRGELRDNARKLVEHLLSFQITGEVTGSSQGPVLTTYEFKPSAGVKLSKIAALQDDLGIVMGTPELRIIAPIPGKTVVGIEVPRPSSDVISLKEIVRENVFFDKKIKVPVALGKTTAGDPVVGDMAAFPHMLVAGATGSGKSVFINSLIMSFLFRLSPQQLRLILVDPKMLELSIFDGIPHLIAPVITDNNIAMNAMNWACVEMDRRYAMMAKTNSKNIESYNSKQKNAADKLPFIVIVVDELADLMMSGGQEVELSITRLAQKARAAGIHLVIATQRPSTDVVTGLIKANIPSRIAFKVPSGVDSRTVLDTSGAESLMGRGDSLMIQPGIPMRRLHGTFVTEEELARVVNYVKGGRNHSKYYIDFRDAAPAPTPPEEE